MTDKKNVVIDAAGHSEPNPYPLAAVDPADLLADEKAAAENVVAGYNQRLAGIQRRLNDALAAGDVDTYAKLQGERAALPVFVAKAEKELAEVMKRRQALINRAYHDRHEAQFANAPAREIVAGPNGPLLITRGKL